MSNSTSLSGRFNIIPDFTTPGSVPKFDSVKLEYRTVRDPGGNDLFLAGVNAVGAITADAPEWVDEEMVVADLTAIIAALPPDTRYVGHLEAHDQYNDMWRVYIADGKPVVVRPTITWPEVPGATTE